MNRSIKRRLRKRTWFDVETHPTFRLVPMDIETMVSREIIKEIEREFGIKGIMMLHQAPAQDSC